MLKYNNYEDNKPKEFYQSHSWLYDYNTNCITRYEKFEPLEQFIRPYVLQIIQSAKDKNEEPECFAYISKQGSLIHNWNEVWYTLLNLLQLPEDTSWCREIKDEHVQTVLDTLDHLDLNDTLIESINWFKINYNEQEAAYEKRLAKLHSKYKPKKSNMDILKSL